MESGQLAAAHRHQTRRPPQGAGSKSCRKSLLEAFRSAHEVASLVDPYGVYQHLMDYWAETMQDDAWMIASDGWKAIQDGNPTLTDSARADRRALFLRRADDHRGA